MLLVRLRATVTVRNDVMLEARKVLGLSQMALAKAAGVPLAHVWRLETLRYAALPASCAYEISKKVADVLFLSPEEVLPRSLHGQDMNMDRSAVAYFDSSKLLEAREVFNSRLIAEDPSESMERREQDAKRELKDVMKRLNKAQRLALHLRMEGLTLEQVGVRMGISKERVRRLEVKAYQKIRDGLISIDLPMCKRPGCRRVAVDSFWCAKHA